MPAVTTRGEVCLYVERAEKKRKLEPIRGLGLDVNPSTQRVKPLCIFACITASAAELLFYLSPCGWTKEADKLRSGYSMVRRERKSLMLAIFREVGEPAERATRSGRRPAGQEKGREVVA